MAHKSSLLLIPLEIWIYVVYLLKEINHIAKESRILRPVRLDNSLFPQDLWYHTATAAPSDGDANNHDVLLLLAVFLIYIHLEAISSRLGCSYYDLLKSAYVQRSMHLSLANVSVGDKTCSDNNKSQEAFFTVAWIFSTVSFRLGSLFRKRSSGSRIRYS